MGMFCADCKKSSSGANSIPNTESLLEVNAGSVKAMFVHLSALIAVYPAIFITTAQGAWFLSLLVLVYLLPALLIRLSSKSTEFERGHSSTFLNLQLSLFIYVGVVVGAYLAIYNYMGFADQASTPYPSINSPIAQLNIFSVLSVLLLFFVTALLNIRAAISAFRGEEYRYPIAIRFLK